MCEPKLLRRPLPPKVETVLLIPKRKDHEATSAIHPGGHGEDTEPKEMPEDTGIKQVPMKSHQILFSLPDATGGTLSTLDYGSSSQATGLKPSDLPVDSIKRDFIIPLQPSGPPSFPLQKRRIPVRLKLPPLKLHRWFLSSDFILRGYRAVVSCTPRRWSADPKKPVISDLNCEVHSRHLISELQRSGQAAVNTLVLPESDFLVSTAQTPERQQSQIERYLEKLGTLQLAETEEVAEEDDGDELKKRKKKKVTYADFDTGDLSLVSGFGCKTEFDQEDEERELMARAEMAVLCCLMHRRSGLSLKAYFLPSLPDLSALADFLVYLNLSFNDLRLFPTEVCDLKYLQILKLRNNPIKFIPEDIKKLTDLKILVMSFNLLTELPSWLFTLQKLELLNVSYNEIEYISNAIKDARSLRSLFVEGNLLYALPSGILKLPLRSLKTENNFLHPFFWREIKQLQLQRLTDLAALCFAQNNLWERYSEIPEDIQKLLGSCGTCDCCPGPLYGQGFCFVRSYKNLYGFRLPYLFSACSPACYKNFCALNSLKYSSCSKSFVQQ